MQNGKLNNSQRSALVKLVQNTSERRISVQKALLHDDLTRITQEVKEELGVMDIEEQIRCHESMIKELEAEKEKLGFTKRNVDGYTLTGSEARKLVDRRVADKRKEVAHMEAEMDRTMSAIWTATELSEAKPLVDEILAEA
ncbi:hypothetical protein ACFL6S_27930 [Candidatus Poribacteria bacterium]